MLRIRRAGATLAAAAFFAFAASTALRAASRSLSNRDAGAALRAATGLASAQSLSPSDLAPLVDYLNSGSIDPATDPVIRQLALEEPALRAADSFPAGAVDPMTRERKLILFDLARPYLPDPGSKTSPRLAPKLRRQLADAILRGAETWRRSVDASAEPDELFIGETDPAASSEAAGRRPQVQEAWQQMLAETNELLDVYSGLLQQLATGSYHSRDFFSNRNSDFPAHLSINTTWGRDFVFDPEMTRLWVYPGDQYPRRKPEMTVALGHEPQITIRAWLAATLLTRLLARVENDRTFRPLRPDGERIFFRCAGRDAEYDAAKQELRLGDELILNVGYAKLAEAVASAYGIRLPLPRNFTFDLDPH